jgi:hypothetical protein
VTISANAINAPRTAPIAAWTRLLFVHNQVPNKVTLWITLGHVDGLSGLSYNPIYVLNSALSVRELLKTHRNPVACHKSCRSPLWVKVKIPNRQRWSERRRRIGENKRVGGRPIPRLIWAALGAAVVSAGRAFRAFPLIAAVP